MSWRKGANLFREMWPLLQTHLPKKAERQEFLQGLLTLMLDWDLDANDIADVHSEVRTALDALGVSITASNSATGATAGKLATHLDASTAACVQQLVSESEKDRATAAQAVEFFVSQAEDTTAAAEVALRSLVNTLQDSSLKVRRAAAKSIDGLLAEGHPLPSSSLKALEQAANKEADEQVRKRIAASLQRITRNARKSPQKPSR